MRTTTLIVLLLLSRVVSAQVQTYLTWDSPLGNYVQINSNQGIQRNAGNAFGYDQGDVESVQTIATGESITFQIGAPGSQLYIGLISSKPKGQIVADNNENGTWVGSDATVKFGQVFGVFGNDSTSAFEDGAPVGTKYSATINQWFRINYSGSAIQYQYSTNGGASFSTFYTSANTASGTYYIYFSAFTLNTALQSIYKTGAGGGNQSPTVSATATNGTVSPPVTTNTLTASASDPDGSISSYSWVKVSGPSGGAISSPTSASTGITGLSTSGTYTYRVTVTDNSGATASADVSFVVTSGTSSQVNAGPDQNLPVGTTSTTLSGSAITASQADLIIFFGESNAAGRAKNNLATAIERLPRTSVRIYNNFNGQIEPLDLDQNNSIDVCGFPDEHGMEIGLADAVEAGRLNNPVYLVKSACSGTRIDQWLNGTGQPSWNEFTRKVDDMLAKMAAQGVVNPNITLWTSIGLNDALYGTPADSFSARINRFNAAVRTKYGAGVRIYMTQFHRYRPDFGETAPSANGHPYNAIIDAIDAADALTGIVETTDAGWIPGEEAIHWSYSGFKVIADRMVTSTVNNRPGSSSMWSKVSGPTGGTITSPSQLVTTVTALQSGTYVFRLTSGSISDDMSVTVGSSQSTFGPAIIPITDPEILDHGRGAEEWNQQNLVNIPTAAAQTTRYDAYYRWQWYQLQTGSNTFDWNEFDSKVRSAIDKGQTFSFGIMSVCVGCGGIDAGGARMGIPLYLHNLMQAEAVNSRDWIYTNPDDGSTWWIPNWNSPNFLAETKKLYDSIYAHIQNTSYSGVPFKNVINVVEVRHFGSWGEWHAGSYLSDARPSADGTAGGYPVGRRPTTATLDSIISYIVKGMPTFKTTILVSAFDANYLPNTYLPPQVAEYALRATNNTGHVGWRRDQIGDLDFTATYIYAWTVDNTRGVTFGLDTAIMDRWKLAPIMGEPPGYTVQDPRGDLSNIPKEVRLFHKTSFGNGNIGVYYATGGLGGVNQDSVRLASKIAGHRIQLEGGSITQTLTSGATFNITANWRNAGLTPVYDKYFVMYSLKNGAGNTVWTDTSTFRPHLFLPSTAASTFSETFSLGSVPAGSGYTLSVRIVDSLGYRRPLAIANQGRQTDGSYVLQQGISVVAGGTNQAPVVSVSPPGGQTITLPTSSVTLTSIASDADGTISSYAWTKVSGGSATITSPTSSTTTVTGLTQGTYSFQVVATDNGGATGVATTTVNVLGASTVNAGVDKQTRSGVTTLSATLPSGATAVAWSKVSGPAGELIETPNQSTTRVSGMATGTYIFRVTATVNGSPVTDDVTIFSKPGKNTRVSGIKVK